MKSQRNSDGRVGIICGEFSDSVIRDNMGEEHG